MLEEAVKLQKLAGLGIKLQREATAKSADVDGIFQGLIADVKQLSLEFKGGAPRVITIKRFESIPTMYKVTFSNGNQFVTDIKHLFNQGVFEKLVLESLGFMPIYIKDWTGIPCEVHQC